MDWTRAIDLYCERITPDFWAEPVNLVSNAAFLLAGVVALVRSRSLGSEAARPVRLLAVFVCLIGLGSAIFHGFATVWAQALDVGPIGLYILAMLYLWLRDGQRFGPRGCLATIGVLVLLSAAFGVLVPPDLVNGSQGYFGVLVVMGWLAFKQPRTLPGGWEFAAATVLFVMSLACRIGDPVVCPAWPVGTHFLWHVLNAFVCYLPLHAYIRARSQASTVA